MSRLFYIKIKEEQNIYEEVDEDEYSRIVRNRQDDDWIVDDGKQFVLFIFCYGVSM